MTLLREIIATCVIFLVTTTTTTTTTAAEVSRRFNNDDPNLQVYEGDLTTSRARGSRSMMNSIEANIENTLQSSRSMPRHSRRRQITTTETSTSATLAVANNDKMNNEEVEEIIELYPLRFDITVPVVADDNEGDDKGGSNNDSETTTVFRWPYVSSVITNSPTTHVPTMSNSPTITMTAGPTTHAPTQTPTHNPTTKHPTSSSPTTNIPSTQHPTTKHPTTLKPTTLHPTTLKPTTKHPSQTPSASPSDMPSLIPSNVPSSTVSNIPSIMKSSMPSIDPTNDPTTSPTSDSPTLSPSIEPTSSSPTTNSPTSDSPTLSPSMEPTSSSPTNSPTSDSPTLSPSMEPTSSSPTNSPTSDSPTLSPSMEPTSSRPTNSPTLPPTKVLICPMSYSQYKTDYMAGDWVEIDNNIFECAGGPYSDKSKYVPYCNIADKTLLAPVEILWWNVAWTLVGPCVRPSSAGQSIITTSQPSIINIPSTEPSIVMTVMPSNQKSNMPSLSFQPSFIMSTEPSMTPSSIEPTTAHPTTNSPTSFPTSDSPTPSPSMEPTSSSPTNSPTSDSPTLSPSMEPTSNSPTSSPISDSPTLSPSIEPTTAHPTTNSPTPLVHCPPAYSQYKTDYVAGDLVEIYSNIFECAGGRTEAESVLYVPYCNIADAYLLDNSVELELWNLAWTHVGGPCYKTESPTDAPTFSLPTANPTYLPSSQPSEQPSSSPSIQSSVMPSQTPTSIRPTNSPTDIPISSSSPSVRQSMLPVPQPTVTPVDLTSTAPSSQGTMLANSTVAAAAATTTPPSATTETSNITTCPDSYDPSIVLSYKAETEVEHEQVIYRCNSVASWAYYCKSTYFRPQLNNPNLTLWKNAWLEIGPCLLAPTTSPHPTYQTTTWPSTSQPATSPSVHPTTLPPTLRPIVDASERFSNTVPPTVRPTTLVPTTAMPTIAKPTTMPPIIIVEEISMTLLPTLMPTESPVVSTSLPTMMNDDEYRYVTTLQEGATNNNFPYPYPYVRYTQWYMLDSDIKTIAGTIGYDRTSWDNLQLSTLEEVRYIDLTVDEQVAVASLGLSSDMWDCYMNHYTGYYWADLQTQGVDVYYEILGYNSISWDYESEYVETEDMSWLELSVAQQDAANKLCFFENSWDWISLMDW